MRTDYHTQINQKLPFTLTLSDGSALKIEEVVRMLPARRLMGRGTWQGSAVYAKIFYGKKEYDYFQRDLVGVKLLMDANIATPLLLWQGEAQDDFVAIFAEITPSQHVEAAYSQYPYQVRLQLMQKLTDVIAQHHNAGLLQTDMYFKNFLEQDDLVYTLDGDGIHRLSIFFRRYQKRVNLATFFSKMHVQDDVWVFDLYHRYCEKTQSEYHLRDAHHILLKTQKIRAALANHYADKKVFRTCTDVKVLQDRHHFIACASDFSFDKINIKVLDTFLADPNHNIKNGNTCTITKTELYGRLLVMKRYNIKTVWHGVKRAFRQSRAAVSWANAHRLQLLKIATPKPLALVEERFGFLRKRAYFLSEFIQGPDIKQYLSQLTDTDAKKKIAYEVVQMFCHLYLLRIIHGDMKATNIKIVNGKPMLLDLDSMQAQPWFFQHKHVKDLRRFMRNWQQDAETTRLFNAVFVSVYGDFSLSSILMRADII